MSLSPFDSFQSRIVTYLMNRPRNSIIKCTIIVLQVRGLNYCDHNRAVHYNINVIKTDKGLLL